MVKVGLASVLAAALVGALVTPGVGVQPGADRGPRSYDVRASVESHRVVEDSGFVQVSGRIVPRLARGSPGKEVRGARCEVRERGNHE